VPVATGVRGVVRLPVELPFGALHRGPGRPRSQGLLPRGGDHVGVAPLPAGVSHLVQEFLVAPRRQARLVPLRQQGQGVGVGQVEAVDQGAGDAEGVVVAALPADGGGQCCR
jgi:hypothetical protein